MTGGMIPPKSPVTSPWKPNGATVAKILVACEFSGTVRDAFTRAGHHAVSCDLLPSETPGEHYQGDIFDILHQEKWDLMIAHPPCTYLAASGARWLYDPRPQFADRWEQLRDGAKFFTELLNADIPRIAMENPAMMLKHTGIRPADQRLQPWQYGHAETKGVWLWLKNLSPLTPTNLVEGREARVHRMAPGPERQKERSRFFRGIADAMAQQWGSVL